MQEAIPELIQGINEGSERIKNIVDRMKHFARQENFRLDDRFDLNQVVQNALAMINNQIRLYTNHFHTRMAEALPLIPGNAQMIEQVIINLVMNALQALTHRQQAVELTTTLDNRNQWVILTITDEGSGMSADVLSRITEPFFTTRQDSGGTGLGLSISYSIIDEHGGTLEFTSTPGRGTTAILCLPTGDTPNVPPDIPFETERTTDKDNSPAPEC